MIRSIDFFKIISTLSINKQAAIKCTTGQRNVSALLLHVIDQTHNVCATKAT